MSAIEGRFQRKLIATYLLLALAIVAVAGLYILSSLKRASIGSPESKPGGPSPPHGESGEAPACRVGSGNRELKSLRAPLAEQPSVS